MLKILRNTKRTYQILFLDETIALKWLVRFKASTIGLPRGQKKAKQNGEVLQWNHSEVWLIFPQTVTNIVYMNRADPSPTMRSPLAKLQGEAWERYGDTYPCCLQELFKKTLWWMMINVTFIYLTLYPIYSNIYRERKSLNLYKNVMPCGMRSIYGLCSSKPQLLSCFRQDAAKTPGGSRAPTPGCTCGTM